MVSKMSASSRWLGGAAASIAILVVVSVVVAVARGPADADFFPETSPEGVVQRYLQAIKSDDVPAAYAYLSGKLKAACTLQNLRDSSRWFHDEDQRITLDKSKPFEGGMVVQVRVSTVHADRPFVPNESSFIQSYYLETEDGAWRFSQPPWPLGYCPGLERKPLPPGPALD